MNDELVNYLKNQIAQAPARLQPYTKTDAGWLSPAHFQDFLKFAATKKENPMKKEETKK